MRAIHSKASLIRSGLAATVLLVAATASYAQTTVGLTAAPTQAVLPDGQSVPMWGYTCDAGQRDSRHLRGQRIRMPVPTGRRSSSLFPTRKVRRVSAIRS